MKPINIYALTRIRDKDELDRFERQMSMRRAFLRIREWEVDGLRTFIDRLSAHLDTAFELEFFYSFTMPKLGKEFDLLRVNDEYIVNIEIKSREVTEEAIKKQLLINRYYLSTIGRNAFFYTYISDTGRLIRLSNSGKTVESSFEELSSVLEKQKDCYTGDIELLFKEDRYLISPLTDPARFLRGEYFLTNQQNDIKRQILKKIREQKAAKEGPPLIAGFSGLPGTGKTILLFDIAMQLSRFNKVCVFHMGAHEKELEQLDERLKRIDFFYFDDKEKLAGI
ncbi:MAG: ATP-binding protein, partial [Lachnospiraceae bacterium]|nr:ATP-binding protein [Lachnospiraceae bacterium]